MSKYIKYRFKTKAIEDYRPLKDMKDIQCPWWCSGEGTDYAIIVCYLPIGVDLFEYWDDAYEIEKQEREEITYTDRFPKPEWIKKEETKEMERKIIEIYADEKKDEGIITFDFRRVDDTEVSNALMKKLLIELSDEYEVEKVLEKMDIEKNIEILEKFIEETKNFGNENGWHGYYDIELKTVSKAIQNILTEREQDKKRIQELENRIDKLAVEMKENGTHYWARRLDNIKEEK